MSLSLFNKKHKDEQVIPGKGFIPVDRVREMAARGFSEPEMIDVMRREGFSADEVDKALTQALRIGVTGESPAEVQKSMGMFDKPNQPIYQKPKKSKKVEKPFKWPSEQLSDVNMPSMRDLEHMESPNKTPAPQDPSIPTLQKTSDELPTLNSLGMDEAQDRDKNIEPSGPLLPEFFKDVPEQQMQEPPMPQPEPEPQKQAPMHQLMSQLRGQPEQKQQQPPQQNREGMKMPQIPETSLPEGYYSQQYSSQDYIDYIVQERFGEMADKMNEYVNQYDELHQKIDMLSQQLSQLNEGETPQSEEVQTRVDRFNESLTDIDGRLSGLERAFKETLPELVDSVRALSDLVQKLRREQGTV